MTLNLTKEMTSKEKQQAIANLYEKMQKKKKREKLATLKEIRGKVLFDKTGKKTALEIQKEMRDEWD